MQYMLRRAAAPLLGSVSGTAVKPTETWHGRYRQLLMVAALAGFSAHILILLLPGLPVGCPLWSNGIQSMLGIVAVLALVEAGRISERFAQRVWFLSALSVGIYSAGQALFTFYRIHAIGPHITDPFFFFWMVPLLAAAALDSDGREGFDLAAVLDCAQLVLLAIALHLFVFGDASRWQTQAEQMSFLKWKMRLLRDLVVLGCLWGRTLASGSRQSRALFFRLGTFYLAYTMADAIYLYAEASRRINPGTWFDILWSVPRLLAVILALTWRPPEEVGPRRTATDWRRMVVLYWAPVMVPLAVLLVGTQMLPVAPRLWTALIMTCFAIAGMRLLVTQFRQEQTLERLHNSNNLLESLIEGTSEAIYMKRTDGRYVLMNKAGARYLGLTPSDVVGKTDLDLFTPATAEFIRRTDRQVMDSGKALSVEETLDVGPVTRNFLSTKNPWRDPTGQLAGVLGLSLDITERRGIEEQLRRAQRMESIGTFSGGIAHDFNNLLTVIKGYSQLALIEPKEQLTAPVREYVEQIDRAANRASSLVVQLLAFSRRQILKPRVISLNDVVSSLESMLPRLIGEDVEIQTQLEPHLGTVKADPGQMEQVLMNLAANARDAMPGGGKLTVETANLELPQALDGAGFKVPAGPYALLTVSDTGVGMDAYTQARVFEPYFTTKPAGKGTGLGLSTVYGIIKQSGGYILVSSERDHGTTFKIYLPVVDEPVEAAHPVSKLVPVRDGHQTILLVDDDQQLRRLAHTVLTKSGFTVIDADNADAAWRIAAGHRGPIHLLLADVVMAGPGGPEIARRISTERPQMRVLYMSGHTDDTIVHHGVLEAGIAFLPKPFAPQRLVEKVQEVLEAPVQAAPITKRRG
jgi:PAS domain S-box-containing protein